MTDQRHPAFRHHSVDYESLLPLLEADGVRLTQLKAGPFRVESCITAEPPWTLESIHTHVGLRSLGTQPTMNMSFAVETEDTGQIQVSGAQCPPRVAMWRGPQLVPDEVWPGGAGALAVRLHPQAFRQTYLPLLSSQSAVELANERSFRHLDAEAWEIVVDWRTETLRLLHGDAFTAETLANCCRSGFEMFLQIWEGTPAKAVTDLADTPWHHQLVRRAEAWCAALGGEPVRLPDLCAALGCSLSVLHTAFKKHLGVSPSRYVQIQRLHGVRRDLLASAPSSGLVTETAIRWGFWHFGRFGQAYKNLFGELPKETARRSASDSGRAAAWESVHGREP